MTKDEALRLALDWLEKIAYVTAMDYEYQRWAREAITAIKEALAQTEQDGECKHCTDGCPACDARKLPEQKPYAFEASMYSNDRMKVDPVTGNVSIGTPQRTWVGLTEAECGVLWKVDMTPFDYYKAIEAKLKAKNETN